MDSLTVNGDINQDQDQDQNQLPSIGEVPDSGSGSSSERGNGDRRELRKRAVGDGEVSEGGLSTSASEN
jgi:hypothetical protein